MMSDARETVSAFFSTRRAAEMAVEHIVQEHTLDRNAVRIVAASEENSAGTKVSGSDLEQAADGEPKLAGPIFVSASVSTSLAEKVRSSFETFGASRIAA